MELVHELEGIRELFDMLVSEVRLENANTPIKLLIDAVLKHEEMLDYFPVLAKPIIAYLEGKQVDYEALSYFIVFLASLN